MSRLQLSEVFWREADTGHDLVAFARNFNVFVYKRGTEEEATLWTAEVGGAEVPQPLRTDNHGQAIDDDGNLVWVSFGQYDVLCSGQRFIWPPFAISEGGGGGGAVDSVAGKTGDVLLEYTDIDGLGDSATKDVGTGADDVAAGDAAPALAALLAAHGFTLVYAGTDVEAERDENFAVNGWVVEGIEPANRKDGEPVFDLNTSPGEEEGIEGPEGPPGPEGPEGPKGDTGATGSKGEKGDTGAAGEKGATGEKGAKGDTGAEGPKGEKGATGSTGPEGPKGATGAEGPQGPKGETGAKGEKGETGPPGEIGAESVAEANLKNLAVTAGKLGESSVETAKIKNSAVTAEKLANNSVNTAKINAKAVTAAKVGDLGQGTEFMPIGFTAEFASSAPGAKSAQRVKVKIPHACTLTGIAYQVGSTSNGKVIVALYNAAGTTRLAKSASATQATALNFQRVAFESSVEVEAGTYILELIVESATGTYYGAWNITPWTRATLGSFAAPETVTPPTELNNTGNKAPFLATY